MFPFLSLEPGVFVCYFFSFRNHFSRCLVAAALCIFINKIGNLPGGGERMFKGSTTLFKGNPAERQQWKKLCRYSMLFSKTKIFTTSANRQLKKTYGKHGAADKRQRQTSFLRIIRKETCSLHRPVVICSRVYDRMEALTSGGSLG